MNADDRARLQVRRQAVEAVLQAALASDTGVDADLHAAMHGAVFPGGQRWRPVLTLAAAEVAGAPWERALAGAAAVELFHSASLVFDDLPCMDDASVRRHAPAVHVLHGEDVAVLAGIGLLTTAFRLLATSPRPRRAVSLGARYAGPAGMLTGQAVDLARHSTDVARAARAAALPRGVADRKTTALITMALQIGASCGRTSAVQRRALAGFGSLLGASYQLLDDALDRDGCTLDTAAVLAGVESRLARGIAALRAVFPYSDGLTDLIAAAQAVSARAAGELREREHLPPPSRFSAGAVTAAAPVDAAAYL